MRDQFIISIRTCHQAEGVRLFADAVILCPVVLPFTLLLLPVQLVLLGNKFQRVTEDSESRAFPAWPIAEKLMAERISALATGYLQRCRRLDLFGDGIWVDGLGECRPGCMVLVLRLGGEELIATLRATVHTRFEVISVGLSLCPRAK